MLKLDYKKNILVIILRIAKVRLLQRRYGMPKAWEEVIKKF